MEKMDIRVRFTRKALQDSLITLMKSKSILSISVKEICGIAGLSRSTFYTYYKDQYDLLQSIEDEASAYFESIIPLKRAKKMKPGEIARITEEGLQYIESNNNSIQVLMSENGDSGFQNKIFHYLAEYVQQAMKNYSAKYPGPGQREYYSVFYANGIKALVQHWLKNNRDLPKKELAAMIAELTEEIYQGAV